MRLALFGGCVAIMARRSRRQSYNELRYMIQRAFESCAGFPDQIQVDGKLNRIAEGIWHDNYRFWVKRLRPEQQAKTLLNAYAGVAPCTTRQQPREIRSVTIGK